jgi:hypothetical protein
MVRAAGLPPQETDAVRVTNSPALSAFADEVSMTLVGFVETWCEMMAALK